RAAAARDSQVLDVVARDVPSRGAATRRAASAAKAPSARDLLGSYYWQSHVLYWWTRLHKVAYIVGGFAGFVLLAMLTLWWRLASGPIEFGVGTPLLAAAVAEEFRGNHRGRGGGTPIERGGNGRTALRIRDIVVRDHDGEIVASAPKAEVGVSGSSLLTGRVRAQRLSLVGAEMQVRIEPDSRVTVFAGANKQTFATA